MIFYQATAPPGWTTDAAVADCVLAFKGGSDDYDDDAGTLVGDWDQPVHDHDYTHTHTHGHTHDTPLAVHTHRWYDYIGSANTRSWNAAGNVVTLGNVLSNQTTKGFMTKVQSADSWNEAQDLYTAEGAGDDETSGQPDDANTDSQSETDTDEVAPVNTWRPYAALSICAVRDA
jgi:hypothetical protein